MLRQNSNNRPQGEKLILGLNRSNSRGTVAKDRYQSSNNENMDGQSQSEHYQQEI